MTVTLDTPYNGYETGELTGNTSGFQDEVLLPNGKLIWVYTSDYTKS